MPITKEVGSAAMNRSVIHPVHAFLVAASLQLFMGTLLSDWAYAATYVVQWANFASWLLSGALIFSGAALIWSLVDILRVDRPRDRLRMSLLILLAGVCLLGLVNALVHARDAWAAMPSGLILSVLVFLLACAATWVGFSTLRARELR